MKINSGQAPSTLVPKYIGSDFDQVVTVGKNIEDVKAVAGAVEGVKVVADNIGSVTNVATNIGDVVNVSDNMDYVRDVAAGIEGLPVISYIGEEPPTQPKVGSSWYCTTDGRTYVWYKDIDSYQWVESSPQSAPLDLQDVREVAIANTGRQMKLLGYDLVKGSFEEGALLSKSTDVVLYKHTGVVYKWKGVFPAQIAANSSPTGTGISNWEEVGVPVMGASVTEALRRSYAEAGYNLVDGSFEAGGTLVNANDVLLQERTGKAFSGPAGVVVTGTDPTLPGSGYVPRTDVMLRNDLNVVVKVFESVADMKADATLIVGQKCRTLGYYAVGDGGGNHYKIVAAATGTDDGGSFIDLTASGLQAKALFIDGRYHVSQWGAKQNGVDSDTTAVNSANVYISSVGGGFLDFDKIYAGGGGFIGRTGVTMRGQGIGVSSLNSLAGWSGNIYEVYDFAALEAAGTAGTSEGCPVSYGLIDCFVDGSGYDGTVSASQGYGVRMYGRKLVLQRCIIGKTKGIGLYTSFPAIPAYVSFDSITDTKFSVIKDVEVIETGYEGFVFNGPTDQFLDNVFVGYPAGSRFDSYDTTGPKTSLLFPGEQIHGIRILRSTEFGFIHSYDNEYGYAVYVKRAVGDPAIRLRGNYLMGESSYGGIFFDSAVRYEISLIETHSNKRGPTTLGAYSASAGLNPHVYDQSELGSEVSLIDIYRYDNEQGSAGLYLSGISQTVSKCKVHAYASTFSGGGKGVINNSAVSDLSCSITSKSGPDALDFGYEESSTASSNNIDVYAFACDVNVSFLGGVGRDSASLYRIKTRSAGTTEISNLARLSGMTYSQAVIITDDGTKRRNKANLSIAVDFSVTGLQTLSIPYGSYLVRDPLESEIRLQISYDTGTMPGVAKLAVSNIDVVNKEIDVFVEFTGGLAGTGKINAFV